MGVNYSIISAHTYLLGLLSTFIKILGTYPTSTNKHTQLFISANTQVSLLHRGDHIVFVFCGLFHWARTYNLRPGPIPDIEDRAILSINH